MNSVYGHYGPDSLLVLYRFYWNCTDKEHVKQVKTCITLIIPENLKILFILFVYMRHLKYETL